MKDVDVYIAQFPKETQEKLRELRVIIKSIVPEIAEAFAYKMPAYRLNGKPFLYFAGYSKHIGFYSMGIGQTEFANELKAYKQGKGSIQFPLDKPLPTDLIRRIIQLKRKLHS